MTRREALASSSPPLLVLLGTLAGFTLVTGGTLAWNLASICRRRHEYEQART